MRYIGNWMIIKYILACLRGWMRYIGNWMIIKYNLLASTHLKLIFKKDYIFYI